MKKHPLENTEDAIRQNKKHTAREVLTELHDVGWYDGVCVRGKVHIDQALKELRLLMLEKIEGHYTYWDLNGEKWINNVDLTKIITEVLK